MKKLFIFGAMTKDAVEILNEVKERGLPYAFAGVEKDGQIVRAEGWNAFSATHIIPAEGGIPTTVDEVVLVMCDFVERSFIKSLKTSRLDKMWEVRAWCAINGCCALEWTKTLSLNEAISLAKNADCGCGEMAVYGGGNYEIIAPNGTLWEGSTAQEPTLNSFKKERAR